MGMLPGAFKVENRVDDVLECLRPGQRAILGDVSNQKHRNVLLLGPEQQLRCHFPHLTDAAGRHLELLAEGRLDGVDDRRQPTARVSAAARIFSMLISA